MSSSAFRETKSGQVTGNTNRLKHRRDGGPAPVPLDVPFQEEALGLKRHDDNHVRHAARFGCNERVGPNTANAAQ